MTQKINSAHTRNQGRESVLNATPHYHNTSISPFLAPPLRSAPIYALGIGGCITSQYYFLG